MNLNSFSEKLDVLLLYKFQCWNVPQHSGECVFDKCQHEQEKYTDFIECNAFGCLLKIIYHFLFYLSTSIH